MGPALAVAADLPGTGKMGPSARIEIRDGEGDGMERGKKREGLLEKTAEVFDLPGDVVGGAAPH